MKFGFTKWLEDLLDRESGLKRDLGLDYPQHIGTYAISERDLPEMPAPASSFLRPA